MIPRKNPKIDLERYKTIFFLVGLNLALLLAILVINIKSYDQPFIIADEEDPIYTEQDVIPITKRELPKVPPPPIPEVINVVDNTVELEVELDIASTETDQLEAIDWNQSNEITAIGEDDEVDEEILNFAVVESVPIFPGCEDARTNDEKKACFQKRILAHVQQNFEYPELARQMNIEGRVFVQFVVEKNGQIDNIQVLRGVDPLLDDEAVRVVKTLPRVEPAKQRGKPVRMSFVLPINAKMIN